MFLLSKNGSKLFRASNPKLSKFILVHFFTFLNAKKNYGSNIYLKLSPKGKKSQKWKIFCLTLGPTVLLCPALSTDFLKKIPVHTVSFLFKLSGLKKLVKWSGYEIKNFNTNFLENSTFYKSFLTPWRQNAPLALMSG